MTSAIVKVNPSAPSIYSYNTQAFRRIVEDVMGDVSERSAKVYSDILYKWAAWCEDNKIHPLDMQRHHVTAFLIQDKVSFGTRKRELYVLAKAMRFASIRDDKTFGKIYELLQTLKAPKEGATKSERRSRALNNTDANKALAAWKSQKDSRGYIAIRAMAINALLASTGLRCAELAALQINDVNLERGTLKVWHGKGDKEREIAIIGDFALKFLNPWLEVIGKDRIYLFPIASKNKIGTDKKPSEKSIYRAVKRIEKLTGLKMYTHRWREALATGLAQNGMPLPNIRDQLGHASLDTTSIYTKSVDAETIRAQGRLGYGEDL